MSTRSPDHHFKSWKLPKQHMNQIYQTGCFFRKKDYILKVSENTHIVRGETESIELFNQKERVHLWNKFDLLHIGLVQVGIKPLTRHGLDKPVCMCLRDDRFINYDQSLLGKMEANIAAGPVYFNCYPFIEFGPRDRHCMALDVRSPGYEMGPGGSNLAIVYRIYYAATNALTAGPKYLIKRHPGTSTSIIPSDKERTKVWVPPPIPQDQLTWPAVWTFKNRTRSKPQAPSCIVWDDGTCIEEDTEGNVHIKFPSTKSRPRTPMPDEPESSQLRNPSSYSDCQ